jgi:hypothetical protein
MHALITSPATMRSFSFYTKPAKALRDAALMDVIGNLHSIFVNPASKPDEVKSAKQRMLRVLREAKHFPLPQMIGTPAEREREIVRTQLPDETTFFRTCPSPVTRTFSSERTLFPQTVRASYSRSSRAKQSDTPVRDLLLVRALRKSQTAYL